MSKLKKAFALALSLLFLAGCKTSETYSANAYDTGDFQKNYFVDRHDFRSQSLSADTKTLESSQFFGQDDTAGVSAAGSFSHSSAKQMCPDMFRYTDGEGVSHTLETDYTTEWSPAKEGDDSAFIGTQFARTKCLSRIDSSFRRGILSRLYNGQTYCLGYYAKARIQLDRDGYDAYFPKTLAKAPYFLISLRGGSNIDTKGAGRKIQVDLKVAFYKADSVLNVVLPDVTLQCDGGGVGELTSYVGFPFSSLSGFDPSGIVGMGLSFDNYVDPSYSDVSIQAKNSAANYFGLELYEVMFPDSSWN